MLGASLYLSEGIENNKVYINNLDKIGVKHIFTSLHIPEDDTEKTLSVISELTKLTNEKDIDLITDVSSGTLEQHRIDKSDAVRFFKDLGIQSLRIDYGFTFEEIKQFSEEFDIVLNASIIDDLYCEELEKVGLNASDISVCHNFYPRENTGLDRKYFIQVNEYLRKKGFSIMAFIPGNGIKRGPVYAGLPTLEEHREINPLEAYLDLKNNLLVDEVLIGDISMNEDTIRKLMHYIKDEIIELDAKLYTEELPSNINDAHTNRKDIAADVVRSAQSRIDLAGSMIQPFNCIERKKGSITIDNVKYGRYSGEIQITKTTLCNDDRVNVLGIVCNSDLGLLDFIGSKGKFKINGIKK